MVLLNFGDNPESIAVPFPKAGTYREMLDDDVRPSSFDISVAFDGDVHTIIVPSHYGFVFAKTS